MDRLLLPGLLFGLSLFAATAFADEPAGAAEYRLAVATGEQFAALLEQMSATTEGQAEQLPAAQKAQKAEQLGDLAMAYPRQLEAASNLGFAPAQFAYAQMLLTKALMQPSAEQTQRDALKAQACELVGKAAASGLFIAALGQNGPCSGLKEARDVAAMLKANETSYQLLAQAIGRPDPYAAYYPLKALRTPECFERAADPFDESLTPLEKIQASQPPMLTLEQTRAEGFYQLANREVSRDKALAREHLQQAQGLGCESEAFTRLQALANKQPTP